MATSVDSNVQPAPLNSLLWSKNLFVNEWPLKIADWVCSAMVWALFALTGSTVIVLFSSMHIQLHQKSVLKQYTSSVLSSDEEYFKNFKNIEIMALEKFRYIYRNLDYLPYRRNVLKSINWDSKCIWWHRRMAVIVFVIKVNQYNMVLTVLSPSKSQNVFKKTFFRQKVPFFSGLAL